MSRKSFAPAMAGTFAFISIVVVLAMPRALSQKPATTRTTEELPGGAMQAKATTSCLECHEARIIVQQRLSKAAWTKEVDKMVKWGAVVDRNDRDALIDYLSANFGVDQLQFRPPRTTRERRSAKNSAGKTGP